MFVQRAFKLCTSSEILGGESLGEKHRVSPERLDQLGVSKEAQKRVAAYDLVGQGKPVNFVSTFGGNYVVEKLRKRLRKNKSEKILKPALAV